MNLPRNGRKWAAIALLACAAALDAASAERAIELRVAGRKPVGGVRTVRVTQGDRVALHVRSDEALTIHVHGYDARRRVDGKAPAVLELDAHSTGRFPVTVHLDNAAAHAREAALLYLEVHPR